MKRLILLCSLAVITLSANAQTVAVSVANIEAPHPKGSWMVGSDILLANLATSDGQSVYTLSLQPKAAYFISNHLAIGVGLNAGISHIGGFYNRQAFGIMPYARYYFGNSKRNATYPQMQFFIEGGAGLNWNRFKDLDPSFSNPEYRSGRQYSVYVMPGASIFLNKNVALDLGLSYQRFSGGNTSVLGFNAGFRIFLGGRKK